MLCFCCCEVFVATLVSGVAGSVAGAGNLVAAAVYVVLLLLCVFKLILAYSQHPDRSTILLTVVAMVLPALAGVSTMWQAQAGLGAKGQV